MVASAAGRELQVTVADLFQQPRLVDLAERLSTRLQAESTETREDADPERFSLWLGVDHADEAQVQGQLQEIAKQCGTAVEKIQDVYPCTPLQQGLMAITGRQSSAYVNRQTFTLDPGLDLDRFQDAWRTLVAVMPILRTRIVVGSESATALHQVVLDEEIVWHHSSSLEDYLRADQQEEMGLGTPLA
ncbi:hypothetical protein BO99DRAFT_337655, partial [Aspergillus violaceofuscus CBS 115571]